MDAKPSSSPPSPSTPSTPIKGPCCVCKDTKALRDTCIILNS